MSDEGEFRVPLGGRLDIGIDRTDPDDTARNEYKVFYETFEGLALPRPHSPITFITPPTPEEVVATLRQSLEALIKVSPMGVDSTWGAACHWCDAPDSDHPQWNKQRKPVQHEHDCPWVVAHSALHRRLPDGHEGKDPT